MAGATTTTTTIEMISSSNSSGSTTDPYDDLDSPPNDSSSFTAAADHSLEDPKTFEDYIEFIKLGNQIKENLVKQIKYETSAFGTRQTASS